MMQDANARLDKQKDGRTRRMLVRAFSGQGMQANDDDVVPVISHMPGGF